MGRVKSKDKKNKRGTLGFGSMFEAYTFLMGFALVIWALLSYFAFVFPPDYLFYKQTERRAGCSLLHDALDQA